MRAQNSIPFTVYGDETQLSLPARFEICPACDGCGTDRGRSVECDGGGFTSSEWAEQDEDFRDDYLSGRYDRKCEECRTTPGRVLVIDRERCDAALLALFDKEQQDECDYRSLCEAERRMGC